MARTSGVRQWSVFRCRSFSLTADGPALKDGVDWRIFGDKAGSDGNLPLLGQASGGDAPAHLHLPEPVLGVHEAERDAA